MINYGKYSGKFEGVNIYEAGDTNGSGCTLSCRGIIISKGQFTTYLKKNIVELLQHEFGHIFKANKVGIISEYYLESTKRIERLYLGGDAYSAPAVYVIEDGVGKIYYICRDYLGSITHVLNEDGSLKQEVSYDAWGALRDPATHIVYNRGEQPKLFLGRGYTGHEPLQWFNLINMNARLYDPSVGRFLSPDPYVQAPDNTQNFNRYTYGFNNPFKYTDPNGEFIHLIIGAIIGGIVNWAVNGAEFSWKGLAYFGIGAAAGALSAAGGLYFASAFKAVGFGAGALVGAGTGALTGGVSSVLLNGSNNVLKGNNFFNNWKSNLLSGIVSGTISGAISGGIKGYQYAKTLGANPWTGNKTLSSNSYSTEPKVGIPPQTDPSRHCYSVANEYADRGHNNLTRTDFQKAAAMLNEGIVPDGADPGIVAREAGLNANAIRLNSNELNQFGIAMQNQRMEGIITIGSNINAGHSVNLVSFDVIEKLRLFGGGSKFLMLNVKAWDPISASVRYIHENILKLEYLKY